MVLGSAVVAARTAGCVFVVDVGVVQLDHVQETTVVCHSDAGHTGELCPGPPVHLPANGRWDFHLITAAPCHAVQQGRSFGGISQ